MNKLSVFSSFLYWTVFWVSLFLLFSYIRDALGVRDFFVFDGWFGHIYFGFFIIILNSFAWFFPVYYLQLISYIRKSQREINHSEIEPFIYDSSSFRNKIKNNFKRYLEKDKRQFIWHFKDSLKKNRKKDHKKQDMKSEQIKRL